MLKGKKILIGVTGSIAAYKVAVLTRLLVKSGAEVRIIMTPASGEFVSPLTLSTLSKNPVLADLATEGSWTNHVMWGRWADIMVVAPLSCNTLAKMVAGICDNLLLAIYLSATCPVVVAPAMDEDMWLHPATKNNLEKIAAHGSFIIPVESGDLASGLTGEGRMAEPEAIIGWLNEFFSNRGQLKGKRAMVTAGPTHEQIDPVRFIGNNSSGKMGIAIAEELKRRGAEVTLILGPTLLQPPKLDSVIRVTSAWEMFNACVDLFEQVDIAVMNAAVADYTPVERQKEKIKKAGDHLSVALTKTRDILKHLGSIKNDKQILVGFALETHNENDYAKKKLTEKNADMIILNSMNDEGAGFGHNTNKVTIFEKSGRSKAFDTKPKAEVAKDIVNAIIELT